MDLQKIEKEVENLNLKQQKDFDRFVEIRQHLFEEYQEQISRGRCEPASIIIDKMSKSFDNYPTSGYENNSKVKHYSKFKPNNFEEMQFMFDDLALECRRIKLFGNN